MPTQDDILDVLGFAKSLNSQIHEYNRNNLDARTNINVITPQNVMKDVKVPVASIPQPPIRQMMDVGGLPVAAPMPLISLAEAFPDGKIPEGYNPAPAGQMVVPPQQVFTPQQAPVPPKNDNQMEFTFAKRIEQRPDEIKQIHHRFDDIELKLTLLDGKLTNLINNIFNKKRKRREEKEAKEETKEGSNGTLA